MSRLLIAVTVWSLAVSSCPAARTLDATAYHGQLKGMWAGQLLGNYAGRQVEGLATFTYEGATTYGTAKAITSYQVPWAAVASGNYYAKNSTTLVSNAYWDGDDDTAFEYLYVDALKTTPSVSNTQLTTLWKDKVTTSGVYIANLQAKVQIGKNNGVPGSGSGAYNIHGLRAIDAQITTESLGALAPGSRQRAMDLSGQFGSVSNEGYAVHAAQFYATMYAAAPFETTMADVVQKGLEAIPDASRSRMVVESAIAAYQADLADNGVADNWQTSRTTVKTAVKAGGREWMWVESSMNLGMTTLAVLYGGGDFVDTVEYGVKMGYDSDCNPATAGGLVGLMKGYDGIVADLNDAGIDTTSIQQTYRVGAMIDQPSREFTLDEVATMLQQATAQQLVDLYGAGAVTATTYTLPDAVADVVTPIQQLQPTGPAGLVGQVQGLGGTVTVVTTGSSASTADRDTPQSLIDGVTDTTYTGQLAYSTYDGGTAVREDRYELHFDREVQFTSLMFYEGDARYGGINLEPTAANLQSGFFTSLTVEVLQGADWVEVGNLALSEALDPLHYFQEIGLTFDAISGTAIRLRGDAGGTRPATTIVELEAYGTVPEPATMSLLALGAMAIAGRRKRRRV